MSTVEIGAIEWRAGIGLQADRMLIADRFKLSVALVRTEGLLLDDAIDTSAGEHAASVSDGVFVDDVARRTIEAVHPEERLLIADAAEITSGTQPGAAPVYDSSGAVLHSGPLAGTHNIVAPATVAAGDILIYVACCRNNDSDQAVTSPPSGFTAFPGNPYQDSNIRFRLFLYWKVADGSEDGATIPITVTGGVTSDNFSGFISRFTAANGFNANPIDGIVYQDVSGISPLGPGPTLTPTDENQLGVSIPMINNNRTLTEWSGATGGTWVERIEGVNDLDGGQLTVQLQTVPFSGTTAVSGGSITIGGGGGASAQAVSFRLVPAEIP